MNKRFTPEEKQRVKDATDIVEVIGRYVDLKKAGKLYKGLSPFKNEKTPSFFVDPVKQRYDCYSTNTSGDVFEFLMTCPKTKWTFMQAVEQLATEKGIHITSMDKITVPKVFKDRLLEINKWAAQWFQNNLWSDPEERALDYLRVRGFEDDFIRSRMMGYAPSGWRDLIEAAKGQGFGKEELQYASLINFGKGKYFDTFRDRIMFPIKNPYGEIISFGGRRVDTKEDDEEGADKKEKPPKYINGRVNTLFKKNKVLYGMDVAKSKIRTLGEAWITEGYLDVEACYQAGITHVIAVCGTNLTTFHGNEILKHAPKVMTMFDGDSAGKASIKKGVDNLLASYPEEAIRAGKDPEFKSLEISVCTLPDGKDPQDFLCELERSKQAESLYSYVSSNKQPFLKALAEQYIHEGDSPGKRASGITEICKTISLARDPIVRAEYCKDIAILTNQDPEDIRKEVSRKITKRYEDIKKRSEYKTTISRVGAGEKELIRWVIANYGKTYHGHITFENKVISDLDHFGYEFHDRNLSNIMDCIMAVSANSQELTVENISKLNRKAARDMEELMSPLKWEEMKPISHKQGYEEDMAFILNNYKKTLIKNRISDLEKKSPRDVSEERILNRLKEIYQEFK